MNNENKILEQTKRIEVLEQEENKRKKKKKIKIIYEITKIVIILLILLTGYIYINIKVIKPYKEAVNKVNDKITTVQDFINDKTGSIKDWFKKDN